ncbi:MAG: DEAD/DEAH box helicase family protein [Dorea sp.]|nr:DEAD/DEAH box helicase family protein [Dorea sp.]
MRLKNYQKDVIKDLTRYLELLNQTHDLEIAYRLFWEGKNIRVGTGGIPAYQNVIKGVPNLCMKVPTGGGKTFLACNAIKPILDALPSMKAKVVVWLVPSDVILTQTIAALKNTEHPYRQKIDIDFVNRVEVYSKQELLSGQNFNMVAVSEQLSILVLSYDSFRGRKESLKAKQENSNLASMAKALGTPANPIEDVGETALLQVINQLSPIVIVDESHHAGSKLSKEMLNNFNPSFILDLTATPRKESNLLCFVDAVRLKAENMVKLPVIVYNRGNQQEVLADAIDLRNCLELQAKKEQEISGAYIRPIVLFQAQPRGSEKSTTFEKLRDNLVRSGIPKEQIAIKTADVNELKGVDLLRPDCPVRYIITINALKEGWDCPFAYILASIANRTSRIEVEQIVGRVLRQPYTKKHSQKALNVSYVLTSSADFRNTLDNIVGGLNSAGFTDKDYRIGEVASSVTPNITVENQITLNFNQQENHISEEMSFELAEECLNFDAEALRKDIEQRNENISKEEYNPATAMISNAESEHDAFEAVVEEAKNEGFAGSSWEEREFMTYFNMTPEFEEEASHIRIPQFCIKVEESFFVDGYEVKLKKEHLDETFSLKGKPYDIDFSQTDRQMVAVDVRKNSENRPKVFQMNESDQRAMKELFSKYSPEQKVKTCKDIIHKQVNKIDAVDSRELARYVDLIVDQMDNDTLSALEKAPQGFAIRIKAYIEKLMEKHRQKQFEEWLEVGKIICQPMYEFKKKIAPLHSTNTFGRSLYQAEEEVNEFEYEMVMALTGLDNIKWWHRNISRQEFCINGFINHYPDFIVMTKSGKILMIETKGDHLENRETKDKLAEGRAWQNLAGALYRYFLVFKSKELNIEGAYQFDRFIETLKKL